jgi:hypothetical protein
LSKPNIRKFLIDRDIYVREIEERSSQDNGAFARPVSLTFSIDPQVLESILDLRQFGAEVAAVAEVTDAVLLSCLEKHRDCKNDSLSAVQV